MVEKKVATLDVTQARFANNVRLNLKPTHFDANTILVSIRFGGGRLDLPRDKASLKLLADQTFLGGGLERHSIDELNRITSGHNIGLEFTVDDDAFVFNGRTTPERSAVAIAGDGRIHHGARLSRRGARALPSGARAAVSEHQPHSGGRAAVAGLALPAQR